MGKLLPVIRMVSDDAEMQRRTGLVRGDIVLCLVTAHRGRFGVDVQIISRAEKPPAFIDFALLPGRDLRAAPDYFPAVGAELEAVVVAFAPNGELRLDARPGIAEGWREKGALPGGSAS
jgi:hypothetical protein